MRYRSLHRLLRNYLKRWFDKLTTNGGGSCPPGRSPRVSAPNRGHNSIAGFSVDPTSGTLSAAGHTATQAVPRAFSLDPQGKFLYAAGLETGNLTSYVIDQATGGLTPSEIYPVGKLPMWVLITEFGG